MADVVEKRRTNLGAGLRRRSRSSQPKKSSQTRVWLEQVLGLTASCSSLSTSSGLVAYPAGCVVVVLNPKTNKQSHIVNSSRKPFSALSFSHDGKLLVTGESGHLPCVRVWDLEGSQKAEVQTHKYGVSCVAFSRSDQYIVSVGFQHDMTVCVWDWKKGAVIASNKVSSRVSSVSFSEDSSYFVTAGTRHLKFWYLHESAHNRVNSTVPLIGRSALLGEHKNSVIVAVACGRGDKADRTFCITSSALLCVFNSKRTMEAWVHLKVSSASSLSVSGDLVFCGCSNGIVRVFSPSLSYISTLQRPHRLGVEVQSSQSPGGVGSVFPDTVALGLDSMTHMLSCVYSDHSLYCWDLTDLKEHKRTYSALYHSGCIWSLEVYPELGDGDSCLPPCSFLSSSSDNTIRVWSTESPNVNRYSQDLLRIVYVAETFDPDQTEMGAEGKCGLRVLAVSPDGAHMATGDRHGNLSIFGLEFVEELHKIEAHNSEILCLTFSPESSGVRLLASGSRDRLIHIFNRDQDYNLIQSLYDHSGSITAVRFTGKNPGLRIVSCGADKSIYVQTAEQGTEMFTRTHHVVEKSSLYDLDLDSTKTQAAFACQDRNIRVYSVENGKLTKTLKGSSCDEGALLKVTFDPSGSFVASSCSDKTICIFDYESGECVATLHGHSEIVTSIRFSADCTRLITASGDGCIFVWRLDSSMSSLMRKRQGLDKKQEKKRKLNIRRETFITGPSNQIELLEESSIHMSLQVEEAECTVMTPGRAEIEDELPLLQTNGKLPLWFRKRADGGPPPAFDQSEAETSQARMRWVEQINPMKIFSPSPIQDQEVDEDLGEFYPQSLESLLVDEEDNEGEEPEVVACSSFGLFPDHSASDREFAVQNHPSEEVKGEEDKDSVSSGGSTQGSEQNHDPEGESLSESKSESRSSFVQENHQEQSPLQKHFDSLALNTINNNFLDVSEERFDTDLKNLQPLEQEQKHFLQPRLSLSTRFLSRFQDRIRSKAHSSVPRILEESSIDNIQVQPQSKSLNSKESGFKHISMESALIRGSTETALKSESTESSVKCASQRLNDTLDSFVLPQRRDGKGISLIHDLNQTIGLHEKENARPDLVCEGPGSILCEGTEEVSEQMSVSVPLVISPIKSPMFLQPANVTSPPDLALPPTEAEQNVADASTPCLAPECDRPCPPPGEQQVQEVALRLQRTAEEAAQLYRQVQCVPALAAVLRDTFKDLHSTISTVCGDCFNSLPENCSSCDQNATIRETEKCSRNSTHLDITGHGIDPDERHPCGHLEHCSHTVELLERYSDLLVQMTRDKLN